MTTLIVLLILWLAWLTYRSVRLERRLKAEVHRMEDFATIVYRHMAGEPLGKE